VNSKKLMNNRTKLSLISLIAVLALGLLLYSRVQLSRGTIILNEKDDGSVIHLNTGQQLQAVLNGNPTTGYNWENATISSNVIKRVGEIEFRPASRAIGAPGKVTMRFKAMAPGQAELKLIYRRPWEKNIPPIDTFRVSVTVK